MTKKTFNLISVKKQRTHNGILQFFQIKLEMESFLEDHGVNYKTVQNQIEKWIDSGELSVDDIDFKIIASNLYYKILAKWPARDYFIELTDQEGSGIISFFPRDTYVKSD